MTVQRSGADECGWRRYPAAGPIRCDNVPPEYYDEADVTERVMQYEYEQVVRKWLDGGVATGVGWIAL